MLEDGEKDNVDVKKKKGHSIYSFKVIADVNIIVIFLISNSNLCYIFIFFCFIKSKPLYSNSY